MKVKRIALWRRVAIVLCFALMIAAGTVGALLPTLNRAFAEGENLQVNTLTVEYSGTLEKGIEPTEYNQLKPYLTVTADGKRLEAAQYEVTGVVYNDGNNTAIVTVSYGGKQAQKAVSTVAAQYQGFVIGVKDEVNGKTPVLNADGCYQLDNNVFLFFTDMTAQDVLDLLDVRIQYQHIQKSVSYTKNDDGSLSFGSLAGGLTMQQLLVTNSSFEAGLQSVEVNAWFTINGASQSATESISLKFLQRQVVAISATLSVPAGEKVYPYTDLRDYLKVEATYNDGRASRTVNKNGFTVSSLLPGFAFNIYGNPSEDRYDFSKNDSYMKNVTVTYASDTSISTTVNNVPVTYAKPFQFSISGAPAEQTVGQPFNFKGLTLNVTYLTLSPIDSSIEGGKVNIINDTFVMQIPLNEVDESFLHVKYYADESAYSSRTQEKKRQDSATGIWYSVVTDAETDTVPENMSFAEIEFIYNKGGTVNEDYVNDEDQVIKQDNVYYSCLKYYYHTEAETLKTDHGMLPTIGIGKGGIKQCWSYKDNFATIGSEFSLKHEEQSGAVTYNKPILDTKAKYLVDVEGVPQEVTLDYRLRTVLRETAATAAAEGKSVEEEIAKIFKVTVTKNGAAAVADNPIWNADYANERYYFLFSESGFYNISFELVGDVWESAGKTFSASVSVAQRYLNVEYGSSTQGNVGSSFTEWIRNFSINFYNRDNSVRVNRNIPEFRVLIYASGSPTAATEIGVGGSTGLVEWHDDVINGYNDKKGIYFLYTSFGATTYYYGSADSAYAVYQINLGQTYATTYARETRVEVLDDWQENLERDGANDIRLYVYSDTAQNHVGEPVSAADGDILHVGNYTVAYKINEGTQDSYDTIVISKRAFSNRLISLTGTIAYDGTGIAGTKLENLRKAASDECAGDDSFYPVLNTTKAPSIITNASATTDLSAIKDVGTYTACFETQAGDGEENDYDCPLINVTFEVVPIEIDNLTLAATVSGTRATSTVYTGNEIIFRFAHDGGDLNSTLYSDNLVITMKSAQLLSGTVINPAFYYINEEAEGVKKFGSISVALAGNYTATVRFNSNVVSKDGEGTKDFSFTVTQAALTITATDGAINQQASSAPFALQADKVNIVGADSNQGTLSVPGFRPLSYTVFRNSSDNTANGTLSDPFGSSDTVPYQSGQTYWLRITGITANNFRYPRRAGSMLADFSYMVNYTFDSLTETQKPVFALNITQLKLEKLEFITADYIDETANTVTVTYEANRQWDIVDFFTTTETNEAYNISVKKTAGMTDPVKNSNKTFTLGAGSYKVTVTAGSAYSWQDDLGDYRKEFTLQVNKQAIETIAFGTLRGTFDGTQHNSGISGLANSYANTIKNADGKLKISCLPDGTTVKSSNEITGNDLLNAQLFAWKDAGTYKASIGISANNYYFFYSGNEADFTNSKATGGYYYSSEQTIAVIDKMQVTAPALGAQRLTTTGTQHTFSLTGNVEESNNLIVYYSTAQYTCNEGEHAALTGVDSAEGTYALKLEIMSYKVGEGAVVSGGENFVWVRNSADVEDIAYTNSRDIEGFSGNSHIAYLHYVTITQELDITSKNKAFEFYYGGYDTASPNQNWENETTFNNLVFTFQGNDAAKVDSVNCTYSYVNSRGETVQASNFKTWGAGVYTGTVEVKFPNTTYLDMSFNVAITVLKLPVTLEISGSAQYGIDDDTTHSYNPTVAYKSGSKEFIGGTAGIVPADIIFEPLIGGTTKVGTYDSSNFTMNAETYSANYEIAVEGEFKITQREITIGFKTLADGEHYGSVYGLTREELLDAENDGFYSMLGSVSLPNGEDITKAVAIRFADTEAQRGRLNAATYDVVFINVEGGNYKVTFDGETVTGEITKQWVVDKQQAQVKIDISLVYGETVDTTKTAPNVSGGIYTVTYSGTIDGEDAGATGAATFTESDNNVTYTGGLESKNYTFVDVSENGSERGALSYKPLAITVTIDNVSGEYGKPQQLTYKVAITSASSYGTDGETVALSTALQNAFGVDENGNGSVWSKGAIDITYGTGEDALAFVVTTNAYDEPAAENGRGTTASAGEYTIFGSVNPDPATAANYTVTFKGTKTYNGKENAASTYTVTKAQLTSGDVHVWVEGSTEAKPTDGIVIVIKKPTGATVVTPAQTANVAAEQTRSARVAQSVSAIAAEEAVEAPVKVMKSLAATVESEPVPYADDEPIDTGLHYQIPYNEKWQSLMDADISDEEGSFTIMYNVVEGEDAPAPSKTDSGWTAVPPQAIDAGYYTVYFYLKPTNPYNYEETGIYFMVMEIAAATNNAVEGNFDLANHKVFETEAEAKADGNAAWVYGLYGENATDGFNVYGNQAITELEAKYSSNSSWSFKLERDGETVALQNTIASASALFSYMFNNASVNFDAGTYCLTITQNVLNNSNETQNYNGVEKSYYFTVAKRDLTITADNATVVYGEACGALTATVGGLVRNNYHESGNDYAAIANGLYELTCDYEQGDGATQEGAEGLPITVALTTVEAKLAEVGKNYNLPTAVSGLTNGTLTVAKRTVAIQISDKSTTYLDSNPSHVYEYKYLVKTGADISSGNAVHANLPYDTYLPYQPENAARHEIITLKTKESISATTNAGTYPIYAIWNTDTGNGGSADYANNYEIIFVNCSYSGELTAAIAEEGAIHVDETFAAGTYTVNKKLVDVEWSATSGSTYVYDAEAHAFTAKAVIEGNEVDGVALTVQYAKETEGAYGGLTGEVPLNAGKYKVTAEFNAETYPNYTTGGSSIYIEIAKASATATASNASVQYGGALADGTGYGITITLPDFATDSDKSEAGDLQTGLQDKYATDGKINFIVYIDRAGNVQYGYDPVNSEVEKTTGVGSYQVVISGNVTMSNFELIGVPGVFTVEKRDVTVTVKKIRTEYSGQFVTQSDLDHIVSAQNPFAAELVDGDNIQDLGIILSVNNALNAGKYSLTAASDSANYNVKFENATNGVIAEGFEITKKSLTVIASASVVYGEELTDRNVEYRYEGFAGTDSEQSLRAIANVMINGGTPEGDETLPIGGTLSYTTAYATTDKCSATPAITANVDELHFLNYEPVAEAGAVVITPRVLTVTTATGLVYDNVDYKDELVTFNPINGDTIVATYAYSKDGQDVTEVKSAGTYSVTITLTQKQNEADTTEIGDNANYVFETETNTITVEITVEKKALNVSWKEAVIDLDVAPNAKNIIVGYVQNVMTVADENDFIHAYYNEADGTTTETKKGIITYSDGSGYGTDVSQVGTYTLKLTLSDSENYCWLNTEDTAYTIVFTATSIKVQLEIVVPQNAEYGDDAQVTVTISNGSLRDVTLTYYVIPTEEEYNTLTADLDALQTGSLSTFNTLSAMPVNRGYYIVHAHYISSENVNKSAEEFAAFIITPKKVEKPVLDMTGLTAATDELPASISYHGSNLEFAFEGYNEEYMTAESDTAQRVSGSAIKFAAQNAGTYTVTFALSSGNYVWADGTEDEVEISFAITQATQAVELDACYTFTYGDEIAITPKTTYPDGNVFTYVYSLYDVNTMQAGTHYSDNVAPQNAGVYHVTVTVSATDNYTFASAEAIILIEKKEVKATVTASVPYGQQIAATDLSYSLSGIVNGENESSVISVNLSTLAAGLTFGEAGKLNGVGRYVPVVETSKTVIGYEYTAATAGASAKLTEVEKDGIVGFYNKTAETANGAPLNYYFTLDEVSSSVAVTPLAVSVVIGNGSCVYGSSPSVNSGITLRWADSVANNQIPADDREKQDEKLMQLLGLTSTSFYCAANGSSNAGTYPISIRSYKNDNYNVTFVDGSYEIRKANLTVEYEIGGGSYLDVIAPEITGLTLWAGGNRTSVTKDSTLWNTIVDGIKFQFTDSTGVQLFALGELPENAGEYFVELIFVTEAAIGNNYTLAATSAAQRRFTVAKLVIEVEDLLVDTGDEDGLYYTGALVTPALLASSWDKYFTVAGTDTNAITVGTYYMTLNIPDFTNVQWSVGRTADYRLAFNIVKARNALKSELTVTGWTYGEDAIAPSAELTIAGTTPYYEYSANNGVDWTTVVPTSAGTYRVRVRANGNANVDDYVSSTYADLVIAKRAIGKPQIEVNTENNVYNGNVLLANVSGFDQLLMTFEYVGNFTVDGNSIALTALNAGTYTLRITLADSNYIWADGDGESVFEQVWTVAPKKLARPTEGKNNFVVNGGIITYLPDGFDAETMNITGNEEGHGGEFTAEITLKDSANYVWADDSVDGIQIAWSVVGVNTVFKVLIGVIASIAGLAVIAGVAQFVLFKQKQKREALDDENENGQSENSDENGEGGEQA